jgi:hypothetical protein
MKTNPLFVDSMRVKGDLILTQVELFNVFDTCTDEIRVHVTRNGQHNLAGIPLYAPLFKKIDDATKWVGLIRLDHLEDITYHFELYKNSELVIATPAETTKASYLLQEDFDRYGLPNRRTETRVGESEEPNSTIVKSLDQIIEEMSLATEPELHFENDIKNAEAKNHLGTD